MVTAGGVLSTVNVVLAAAAARLPALSTAEPASMAMASVPSPVMLLIVTVRVAPVPASRLIVPVALPVLIKCTLDSVRWLEAKSGSVYVTVYVIGPPAVFVIGFDAALMLTE